MNPFRDLTYAQSIAYLAEMAGVMRYLIRYGGDDGQP